jgi:hypothetical protein
VRLPNHKDLAQEFGWAQCKNQKGKCGRYPQARLCIATDLLNRLGLETFLVPWKTAERDLAAKHILKFESRDLVLMDRGYAGYELFAHFVHKQRSFVCRCARNTFGAADQLFAQGKGGLSRTVETSAPNGTVLQCREAGLPETLVLRFVSVRLPDGQIEVLVTNLTDEQEYPVQEFGPLYRLRWNIEIYYYLLKSRLGLESFTGYSVESIYQDVFSTVYLSNLESVLTGETSKTLALKDQRPNHAVCFHTIKVRLMDLLLSKRPIEEVVQEMRMLFECNPVPIRPERIVPRKKKSIWRCFQFQRCRTRVF